jgi:hypothetical protein
MPQRHREHREFFVYIKGLTLRSLCDAQEVQMPCAQERKSGLCVKNYKRH